MDPTLNCTGKSWTLKMKLDRQKSWQALRIIVAWQISGPDKCCLDDWLTVPPATLSGNA